MTHSDWSQILEDATVARLDLVECLNLQVRKRYTLECLCPQKIDCLNLLTYSLECTLSVVFARTQKHDQEVIVGGHMQFGLSCERKRN